MSDQLSQLGKDLHKATGVLPHVGALASNLTTFKIGGPIEYLIEPNSKQELVACIQFLKERQQPYRMLGAGSNLLVSSKGLAGWVIKLGQGFRYQTPLEREGGFKVGAATALMLLSRDLSEAGYAGLEFAGGIPASIGGAVRMNSGAYGGQIANVLEEVHCVNTNGEILHFNKEELQFAYRYNSLARDLLIYEAHFKLQKDDPLLTSKRRQDFLNERRSKQPLAYPSAGSIFRNPEKLRSAGLLIEQAGLKGTVYGGAKISEQHANWILNFERRAVDSDVSALISLCQEQVLTRFGVKLETEVVRWP